MDLMTYLLATKQGGGGTEVVANPEGETPTDDLESLKVGEKTYAIPESGSTEPFFVTVTADSEGNVTADKTLSEIFTAINANKNVYMNWVNNSESAYSIGSANMIALDCYYTDSSLRLVNFYRYVIGDGDVTFMNVKIYDAEIVVTEQMLTSY